jgi:crotonobetainyl-CoA:carnitine CoA-transferase CaiB-like acyl-CoA transferase
VPAGAVRSVTETLADPQLHARDMIVELPHASVGSVRVLGNPLKLSDTPPAVNRAPPTLGQHTRSILRNDVGLSDEEIRSLIAAGVCSAGL